VKISKEEIHEEKRGGQFYSLLSKGRKKDQRLLRSGAKVTFYTVVGGERGIKQ